MADFGRAAASLPPDYRHDPSTVMPLNFPFALDGAKVDRVPLAPPSLDGLEFLRGEAGLSARNIILVTSPLSPRAIGALRWPDVEAILTAALDLLPADLVALMRGEPESEAEGSPSKSAERDRLPAERFGEDALANDADIANQLDLNPADFETSV
jgi:hypothetical protein